MSAQPSEELKTAARKRRARRKRAGERGIALVMVLGAIVVLTVMLAEFQEETSAELAGAIADRDSVQAEYFARSAVNLSRLLVAAEPSMRQAIAPLFMMMRRSPPQLPVWEFTDRLLGAFNDEEGSKDFAATAGLDMSLAKNVGLKGGRFEVVIVDEDSKINVNLGAANEIAHIRLARQLMAQMAPQNLNPLFERRDLTGTQHLRGDVCSAIIDWADIDEQAFNCDMAANAQAANVGAEDAYYQYLQKPFRRKNAPFDSLEELHMVRGVTDDFWATIIDPDPKDPRKRNVTVWGQGTVNVNSANPTTLLALICSSAQPTTELCIDPAQMSLFVSGVTMAKGISMGAPIFGTPQDFVATLKGQGMLGPLLATMGLKPVKFLSESEFQKTLSTESKLFSIYAVGAVKGYKRETRTSIHAVVDFRAAPSLLGGGTGAPGAPGTPGSPTTPGSTTTTLPPKPGQGPDAIAGALAPATGGQVLFYKIQ